MSDKDRVFDIQLDLLKTELEQIGSAIRQGDEITKSVKNWAIVTWTAAVGFVLKDAGGYVGATAVLPIVFWFVDGSFRRIQRSFIVRMEEISDYFNSEVFRRTAEVGAPMDFKLLVMRKWEPGWRNTMVGTMLFRSVWLLYVGLAACSGALWLSTR